MQWCVPSRRSKCDGRIEYIQRRCWLVALPRTWPLKATVAPILIPSNTRSIAVEPADDEEETDGGEEEAAEEGGLERAHACGSANDLL